MADQSYGDELRALETRTTRSHLMRRAETAEARVTELEDAIRGELSYPVHQRDWATLRKLLATESRGS